ncbi:MAG: Peptidase propeptide and domain [Chthonomonadaceae bacterium]|nr:Peptidase propeptide and domain [Chthonomonadaceae bacterium]
MKGINFVNTNRSLRAALAGLSLLGLLSVGFGSANADQTPKTKFSASQAEAAALKKYKGGKIQGKSALENEEGKWQYGVMVKVGGKMHEVMVDANTGKIASEEVVTAKEEAAEKKAEEAAKKSGKTAKGGKMKSEKSEKGEKPEKGEKE